MAGDINGDGFNDLLISVPFADPGGPGDSRQGETYLVFGGASNLAVLDVADGSSDGRINLSNLNGTTGLVLEGIDVGDLSGRAVSSAGDVNGDGFDDLLIGAEWASPGVPARSTAGESYLVFGGMLNLSGLDSEDGTIDGHLELARLDGTYGFILDGGAAYDFSGVSISSAGDVNGDGFDDLLIGAYLASPGSPIRVSAGRTYLLFGGASHLTPWDAADGNSDGRIELSRVNGIHGFVFNGIDATDYSGRSVSSAGDLNGDGFDDLLIGAYRADPGAPQRSAAGESYVLFGGPISLLTLDSSDGASDGQIELSRIDGTNGFVLEGIGGGDQTGRAVSRAGDVDGDGFGDLLVSAFAARPGSPPRYGAGETYLFFGGNFTGGAETQVGGAGNQTLTAAQGAAAVDILIGGNGNDSLVSDGGVDVLIGGEGDDSLTLVDVNFSGTRRLDGGLGTDTLVLLGSGLHLDLTAIADNRIREIEIIDLTGSGDNTLTLDLREVLNFSDHSNTLLVRRNAGDTVNIGAGWTAQGNEVIGPDSFAVFTQGAAVVKVQNLNVAPTPQDDDLTTNENTSISGNLITDDNGQGVDTDPNGDTQLVVSQVNGQAANVGTEITLASGALLTVNANGSYTYAPNGQFENLNVGQQTTDSFTYIIKDPGNLESTAATVTITITGENDAPVATDNVATTSKNDAVGGNVLTDGTPDSDVDNAANSLMVSEVNGQAGNVGTQITLASGALLTVNANGT
ncbi:MAG: FG-GAP repeat protein, partial [Planctomycetaceae bacterium]|nr:FG-GAP repeat protein [Planctomycetaceae bacterium]